MPEFRAGKPVAVLRLLGSVAMGPSPFLVPWDSIIVQDPAGIVTTGAGARITVDRPGLYTMACAIFRGTLALPNQYQADILVNGVIRAGGVGSNATVSQCIPVTWTDQLDEGDYIQAQVTAPATGGQVLAGRSFMSVVRAGPVRWT